MKNYLAQWNLMRTIRLILGLLILGEGAKTGQWILAFFGLLFTSMAIFNLGCCAGRNCSANLPKDSSKEEEVIFEEVK